MHSNRPNEKEHLVQQHPQKGVRRKKKRRALQQPLSRSERQRKQVRRSKMRRFTRSLAFMVLTAGMAFLAVTVFFRVNTLEVTGTEHYTAEELAKSLGVERGDNLFSFRVNTLERKLLAQYPYLTRVEIERKMPDGLRVRAVDAIPAAAIDMASGGYYLVDAKGKMLEQVAAAPQHVAPVTGIVLEEAVPGERLAEKDKQAVLLRLLHAFEKKDMIGEIDFINVSAAYDIRFGYLGRLDVRIGEISQLTEKLRWLETAVAELSPTDVRIVYVTAAGANCPPTTREQIEASMLPLEDIIPAHAEQS